MEDNITEKFALLNLIKALQGISAPSDAPAEKQETPSPAAPVTPPAPYISGYEAMTLMLEQHEAISNRVRNKK